MERPVKGYNRYYILVVNLSHQSNPNTNQNSSSFQVLRWKEGEGDRGQKSQDGGNKAYRRGAVGCREVAAAEGMRGSRRMKEQQGRGGSRLSLG